MKISFPILAATTCLLCACVETREPPAKPAFQPDQYRPGTLAIVSDPPGADVQVNGRLVGRTPCTAEIPVLESNRQWILQQNLTVTALPSKEGETLQTKVFDRFTAAPKQVAFEFRPKAGRSRRPEEEEFSSEWDQITGGRSHELNTNH